MVRKGFAVTSFAPAKINLALHVTGQHENGYHLLDTLVAFADIGDRVTLHTERGSALRVTGPGRAGVPASDDNILRKVAARFWTQDEALSIDLEKHLPVASGIGGGSADAAAAYRAMKALRTWTKRQRQDAPGREDTDALFQIGADVPMCVLSEPARVQGFGEKIAPIKDFPVLHAVLVNPGVAVSTPKVFAALQDRVNAPMTALSDPLTAVTLMDWLQAQRNDLQAPAITLVPNIEDVLTRIGDTQGCRLARMSGSGATCFGLYGARDEADQAAEAVIACRPDWWVRSSTLTGQDLVAPKPL
ncbi:4-(cytidine 5'-diphospho)-2-C-methyl-D-erythritol kinase [Sulfitobacter aestuariivivens]|uniref:4-diphosphocytidyl-2-C-methyl-D-erythritol kinase n=1 Tax=Sulfitobacter aestuariivivens TaxID=2766981 RepID=A0A927HGM4_9RHOB|nr:4-(cytidine 5'-diphospho)-2-C-methyl-D-erythritol kinase [Sulfitobacter aestuariivivens]MBD3664405.1 4-(cytidine 5'-diphospho)-2-C-methyl-D-erythritol kinase [Sulfitobacter aestuariivivens]